MKTAPMAGKICYLGFESVVCDKNPRVSVQIHRCWSKVNIAFSVVFFNIWKQISWNNIAWKKGLQKALCWSLLSSCNLQLYCSSISLHGNVMLIYCTVCHSMCPCIFMGKNLLITCLLWEPCVIHFFKILPQRLSLKALLRNIWCIISF